jgi:haloacetate dehalogenase
VIGKDPDFFYEFCLTGWGATRIEDFEPDMLDAYRRSWRDPAMIHGSCSDYRAAATVDLEHDGADLDRKVACPTLAFWGSKGVMHRHFDIAAAWRARCASLSAQTLPGGHFFIDQCPQETARTLLSFLAG